MSSKPLGFGNRHIEPNPAAVKDKLSLAASMKPTPVSDDLPTAKEVERIVETQEGTIRQQPLKIASKRKSKGIVQPSRPRRHLRFVR